VVAISAKCGSCGAQCKAPESLAGKSGKCPNCGAEVRIPEAKMQTSSSRPTRELRALEFVRFLGVEVDDDISNESLEEITNEFVDEEYGKRLATATPKELVGEMADRGFCGFMMYWEFDSPDEVRLAIAEDSTDIDDVDDAVLRYGAEVFKKRQMEQ